MTAAGKIDQQGAIVPASMLMAQAQSATRVPGEQAGYNFVLVRFAPGPARAAHIAAFQRAVAPRRRSSSPGCWLSLASACCSSSRSSQPAPGDASSRCCGHRVCAGGSFAP